MSANFTPGPWEVLPIDGKYYGTQVRVGEGVITVWTPDHHADPFASAREIADGWEPCDGHDHVEDAQSYANASLIAAAPELLEALTAVVAELDRLSKDNPQWPTSPMREASAAAIAKATGAQP